MCGNEKDLEAVLARVHELENRVQWMRRAQGAAMWSGAVLLVIVGMLPMLLASGGSGPEKELRASRFVLVDDKGAERAELSFGANGQVGLILGDMKSGPPLLLALDDDGLPFLIMGGGKDKARVGMSIMKSGKPHLGLWSPGGKSAHIGLSIDKEYGATLRLRDQRGKARVVLAADDPGNSGLNLLDAAGKIRGSFVIGDEGQPSIALDDPKGNTRVAIGTEKDGSSPSISLWDEKTQASLGLILFEDHSSTLLLTDKNGKQRLVIGVDGTDKPGILLNDKEEKAVWKAP